MAFLSASKTSSASGSAAVRLGSDEPRRRALSLLGSGFLVLSFVIGGASRTDVMTQPMLQIVAITAIAYMLMIDPAAGRAAPLFARWPIWGMTGLMAVQLLPLPHGLWSMLPGHGLFAGIDAAGHIAQSRPLSLFPDGTRAALLGMLVPLAGLFVFARPEASRIALILGTLLVIAMLSGFLGLMQMGSGSSTLYLYRITNVGFPVGLFSNRNHQALMMSLIPPMVAGLALHLRENRRNHLGIAIAAGASIVFAIVVVLFAASRLGLALMLLSLPLSATLFIGFKPRGSRVADVVMGKWLVALLGAGIVAISMSLIVLIRVSDRALASVARVTDSDIANDGRLQLLPYVMKTAWAYFPTGGGFGAFVPLYEIHEPFETLSLSYLNHAHNDVAELLIEGGLVAIAGLLLFLGIFVARTFRLWRKGRIPYDPAAALARLGSILLLLLLLGGLTDYPLRTPSLALLATLAMVWMGRDTAPVPKQSRWTARGWAANAVRSLRP